MDINKLFRILITHFPDGKIETLVVSNCQTYKFKAFNVNLLVTVKDKDNLNHEHTCIVTGNLYDKDGFQSGKVGFGVNDTSHFKQEVKIMRTWVDESDSSTRWMNDES